MRLLAQYPDVVNHTFKTLEPTTILTYLFRLTHQLSSSYDILRVVGAPEGMGTTIARAALYEAARQTIHAGMKLLGLSPVDRYVFNAPSAPSTTYRMILTPFLQNVTSPQGSL